MTNSEPSRNNGSTSPKLYVVVIGRMFTEANAHFLMQLHLSGL